MLPTADAREQVARELARIGYDELRGQLGDGVAAWSAAGLPLMHSRVVSADELARMRADRPGLVVLDVRWRDEWDAGHIPGALHLPLNRLTPDEVPNSGPVLVICRSGSRSTKAAQALAAAGHEVGNVVGGMTAWAAIGGPMEADTGGHPVVA